MPAGRCFRRARIEVWFPISDARSSDVAARDNHPGLYGWGRLKPGVTREQAQARWHQRESIGKNAS